MNGLEGMFEMESGGLSFNEALDLLGIQELNTGSDVDGCSYLSNTASLATDAQDAFLSMLNAQMQNNSPSKEVSPELHALCRDLDFFQATGELPIPSHRQGTSDANSQPLQVVDTHVDPPQPTLEGSNQTEGEQTSNALCCDLDFFRATGELPNPYHQQGTSDANPRPLQVVDAHVANAFSGYHTPQPTLEPSNQTEGEQTSNEDATDSLFGDSPASVSSESVDDATRLGTSASDYHQESEPEINAGIDVSQTQSTQILNVGPEYQPASVRPGPQPESNRRSPPGLSTSPSLTPPEPLPITPPDFIPRPGTVAPDWSSVDTRAAEVGRGEKRKRVEESPSSRTHGNVAPNNIERPIINRSHNAAAHALPVQTIPMTLGGDQSSNRGVIQNPHSSRFAPAPSQPSTSHAVVDQRQPMSTPPVSPTFSTLYPHIPSSHTSQVSSSSTSLPAQQSNHNTSVLYPLNPLGSYNLQYVPTMGPSGLHQQSQINPPQVQGQYNNYTGSMNWGGAPVRGTQATSSQLHTPYPNVTSPQATAEPDPPVNTLRIHFEDGSGMRSSRNPHKRSPYAKMKKSDIPTFVICRWKDTPESAECRRHITFEERTAHFEQFHRAFPGSTVCKWVKCGRSFEKSRLVKHFNSHHHPYCRLYCTYCDQGFQEERGLNNHLSSCTAKLQAERRLGRAVAGPSGQSRDGGEDIHRNKRRCV
ncbi:hypothetical protein J3R30DRAFT_137351 [Lentinula aciculospora]|uniref:Uncharacterized protein n=1 Tax=Lentinula aciculospora TaxID=153920 RepID=A0A9W9AUF4_9AGAR|nr:hypothetical protein J3R30DRAFT_137351 [Lentinula aciculospora]